MSEIVEIEPGTVLGDRFRVVHPLGRGAFGAVYTCEDLLRGDRAAVKLLHRPAGRPLGRFYLEYRALRRLNHPNIVSARTFSRHGGQPFIAMDLVDGAPLTRALGPLPASPETVVAVLRQALDALATVHERGLVHRDLKPANALLTRGGHLWLLDFGAVLLDEPDEIGLVTEGGAVGTVAYMAPEILKGQGFDARVDLYSLGVIAHELLAGRMPYRITGPTAVAIAQVLRSPPARLAAARPDLPPALMGIVDRLMERDPEARFPDAGSVIAALHEAGLVPDGPRVRPVRGDDGASGEDLPLLGRADALAAVARAAGRAARRRGEVVRIGGEPGCGISRFLREARARLDGLGWWVVPGQPGDQILPGGPGWNATTRALLEVLGQPAERFGPLVAALAGSGTGGAAPAVFAEEGRPRLEQGLHGWCRLLAAVAARRPVAVLIEDVARLSRTGRALADALVEAIPEMGAPVLAVVGGSRDPDVELGRLSPADLEALFPERGELGVDDVRAARVLYESSRGTPALVTATLARWARDDLIHAVPGGFTVTRRGRETFARPEGEGVLPGRGEDRYRALLDGVGLRAQRLLAVACALEPPTTLGLLARAAGWDEWELLAPLEELVDAGLLHEEAGDHRMRPLHPALGAAVGELLTGAEVRAVHARVADALRADGAPDGLVASHLLRAGRPAEAAEAWYRAAGAAFLAHDVAGAFEASSRAAVHGADPSLKWRAQVLLCRSARLLGELEAAARASADLLQPPPGVPDADRVHAALLAASWATETGDAEVADSALEAAARVAAPDPSLRAEVHLRAAQALQRRNRIDEADREAQAALLRYREAGSPRGIARALHTLAAVVSARGDAHRAAIIAREAIDARRDGEDRLLGANARQIIAISHIQLGEWDAAERVLEEARERFAESGDLRNLAVIRAMALEVQVRREREPPQDLVREVLRYATRLKVPVVEAYVHGILAGAGGLDGSPSSAVRSGRRASELYLKRGNRALAALAEAKIALAERARDRMAAADDASARAVELAGEDIPEDLRWQVLVVRAWSARDATERAVASAGARDAARRVLEAWTGGDAGRRERLLHVRQDLACTFADALDLLVDEDELPTVDAPLPVPGDSAR